MLNVNVHGKIVAELFVESGNHVLQYLPDANQEDFICLSMPVRKTPYVSRRLFPYFCMHLPEGYLADLIRRQFTKITKTDEFGLLTLLAPAIKGRVTFSDSSLSQENIALQELLKPKHGALFSDLVERFALHSPVSGVQPKVLTELTDKVSLRVGNYIVKAWGDDFPELALNEFICMSALQHAGLSVPNMHLSEDRKLFISERVDLFAGEQHSSLGIEELAILNGLFPEEKYQGSYEQAIKTLTQFITPKYHVKMQRDWYKFMLFNHIVGNGDAHQKNIAITYQSLQDIQLAPFYDVVSTTAYIPSDVPALLMRGSKRWFNIEKIRQLGQEHLNLSVQDIHALESEVIVGITYAQGLTNTYLPALSNEGKVVIAHLRTRFIDWLDRLS